MAHTPNHPLPKDSRARHDLLPEGVEEMRDLGDDDPASPRASPMAPPDTRRTPEPSFGADEEGDVPPAEDNDRAAWVREAE